MFEEQGTAAVIDFDWPGLERRLGEFEETDRLAGADALRVMTSWVAAAPGSHAKFIRFLALASALHPDEFPNLSRLAYESGCTRANLSRASKLASRQFGVRIPRSKATPPDVRRAVAARA